jgi:hypothetical protein
VFNNIYRARLQATAEYSRIGQAARERHQQPNTEQTVTKKTVTPEQIEKLRDSLGEDAAPLLDILQSQQEMLDQLAPNQQPVAPVAPHEPAAGIAEQGLVNQQIDTFFTADDMKVGWSSDKTGKTCHRLSSVIAIECW